MEAYSSSADSADDVGEYALANDLRECDMAKSTSAPVGEPAWRLWPSALAIAV